MTTAITSAHSGKIITTSWLANCMISGMNPRAKNLHYKTAPDRHNYTDTSKPSDQLTQINSNVLTHKQWTTRCQSPGSLVSAWPELIIACDVRGRGLLQTEGHNVSFAFTGNGRKKIPQCISHNWLKVFFKAFTLMAYMHTAAKSIQMVRHLACITMISETFQVTWKQHTTKWSLRNSYRIISYGTDYNSTLT